MGTVPQMEITVETRSVYGNTLVYPVCQQAHLLAELIGKKTFSHRDMCLIEAMGFAIYAPAGAVYERVA